MDMETIAQGMALSLSKNKNLKSHIYRESIKRFDGDYDILYTAVKDLKINTESLTEKIASEAATKRNKSKDQVLKDINATIDKLPLLNVATPVNLKMWNNDAAILVAVLPIDFEEATHPQVKAFDAQGNELWLDAKVPPQVPVVVIGTNERVIFENGEYKDRITKEKIRIVSDPNALSSASSRVMDCDAATVCGPYACYPSPDPCVDCYACQPTPETCPLITSCAEPFRQNNIYERVCKIYMTSSLLGDVEGWPAGSPEIDMRCFAGDKSTGWNSTRIIGSLYRQEPSRRDDIRDKWWRVPNSPALFAWNNTEVGDLVMFSFTEYDDPLSYLPKTIEAVLTFKATINGVEVSATPLKATWQIDDKSEDIGEFLISQRRCPPSQDKFGGAKCYNINKRGGLFFITESRN